MFATKFAARRRGFTLIELLIVIVVIAILALIVIPRLMSAGDRARAASYRENLGQIQKSLEQFHTDMGVYPSTLDDLYVTAVGTLSSGTTSASGYTAAGFHGPYLVAANGISATVPLPPNPYVTNTSSSTSAANWTYALVTGPPASYTLVGNGTNVPPSGF